MPVCIIYNSMFPGLSYLIDLGTQLPLTLFLSLVKLPYYIQELIDYMDDPIKRTIPVRHLPVSMQAPLLHKGYVCKQYAMLQLTVTEHAVRVMSKQF